MSADRRSFRRVRSPAAILAVVLLLLAGCVTGAGTSGGGGIPSWPTPYGELATLAYRYWPVDAAQPAPAVVLLHGCGGWYGDNVTRWASWFNARGYHALAIDSFGSRGHSRGICDRPSNPPVAVVERVHDAYGAMDWLARRPEVDASRILVSGFSHGGWTALTAVQWGHEPKGWREGLAFRAAIPFYPYCDPFVSYPRPTVTTQIVIGEKDDWTRALPCVVAARNYKGPHLFRTHVIPGAYHSFDMFAWRGQPVHSRSYLGHVLEPNISAVREAERVVDDFLREIGLPAGPTS